MSEIDVPVRLVVSTDNLEADLSEVLAKHGSLIVNMCPSCFALVPATKMGKHAAAMGHE